MNKSTAIIIFTYILLVNKITTSSHSTATFVDYPKIEEFENQNLGFIVTQMLKRRHGSPAVNSRGQSPQRQPSVSNDTIIETGQLITEKEDPTQAKIHFERPFIKPTQRSHRQLSHRNISNIVSEVFTGNRQIPIEIPQPIFLNLTGTDNTTRGQNQNSVSNNNSSSSGNYINRSTLPLHITRGDMINITTSDPPPVESQLISPTLILNENNTESATTDENIGSVDSKRGAMNEEADRRSQEAYNRKLSSVLNNIRNILPILSILQHNMTDLLNTSRLRIQPDRLDNSMHLPEAENNSGLIEDEELILNANNSEITLLEREPHTIEIEGTTQEFSFPIPTVTLLTDEENPEYIHHLIDELYPKESFENLIKVVKTMPPKSQEVAYEKIADDIVKALQSSDQGGQRPSHSHGGIVSKYGKMKLVKHDVGDLIALSCELYGKFRFQRIIQKYDIFESFAFPTFFRGETQVYLEAQTRTDGFQNLYFDRRKQIFGITNDPTRGVFQSWSYLPVNDGCYFLLKSFEADFIVGVVVTKSAESPLLAKNVLGVAGPEDGKTNYRFHWKIIAYRDQGTDHALLLLENRETNLVLEWSEDGSVHLNSNSYEKNQLWDQGQRLV